MTKFALFLDEDMPLALGLTLRKRGFDVIHAQELNRKGRSDAEQLAYAVEQKKCLLSFNVKDFVILHNEYVKYEKKHWGIIVSKQLPIGETLKRVLKLLKRFSLESMKNRIEFL